MYLFWSQYFVIWYANIPEETFFIVDRLGSEFVHATPPDLSSTDKLLSTAVLSAAGTATSVLLALLLARWIIKTGTRSRPA
jgi:hypothetical protein